MSEPLYQIPFIPELPAPPKPRQRWVLHITLFVLTFITCTMAGVAWTMRDPYEIENWCFGFTYAILLLLFLSSHEFGHYFAARIHKEILEKRRIITGTSSDPRTLRLLPPLCVNEKEIDSFVDALREVVS